MNFLENIRPYAQMVDTIKSTREFCFVATITMPLQAKISKYSTHLRVPVIIMLPAGTEVLCTLKEKANNVKTETIFFAEKVEGDATYEFYFRSGFDLETTARILNIEGYNSKEVVA